METLGVKPVTAYASHQTHNTEFYQYGGQNVKNDDEKTYLKKTLLLVTLYVNKKECVEIKYTVEWTKMPKYRNLDVVSLSWSNARYQNYLEDYLTVEHNAIEHTAFCIDGDTHYINEKTKKISNFSNYYAEPGDLKNGRYFVSSYGIVAAVKLHMDYDDKLSLEQRARYTRTWYTNEKVIIHIFVEIETGYTDMTLPKVYSL